MDAETTARFELRARILKALAHPTRLFIIDELSRNEQCVCVLTAMIGADISTVSKHLSILKNAGIVGDEKRGSKIFYFLKTRCVLNFFWVRRVGTAVIGTGTAEDDGVNAYDFFEW